MLSFVYGLLFEEYRYFSGILYGVILLIGRGEGRGGSEVYAALYHHLVANYERHL